MTDVLDELVGMSRELGAPHNDYAIIGEGNTSARVDAESFWVKASGTQLGQAGRDSFVRVRAKPILEALKRENLDDAEIMDLLKSATLEGGRAPSIETFLHALCLRIEGVNFVGHAHPTAAVGLLCAKNCRELFAGSLFPDQITVLGPEFAYMPYADPGRPLSLTVQSTLDHFLKLHQREPKVLLMENHGVIALGQTAREVLNLMAMLVKTCRIIAVTLAAGGPRFLTPAQVDRIDKRPDELARRNGFR